MKHPESTPSTVQRILYQNIENWKDPITRLSEGKISRIEFKQFVLEQFNQIESEFVHFIRMNANKQIDAQKIFDDNLKTKAILSTVLDHPELIAPLKKAQRLPTASASSLLIPATEGGNL